MAISIVVPLYNKEKHIRNTLKKVLEQSYKDYEIIIVDDGSTDGSVEIVKTFKDNRIHLFTETNSGASAARNYGCSLATYDYVAFLDADDEWDTHYLEKMSKLIDMYPNAAVYGANYCIIENGKSEILAYPGVKKGYSLIENYYVSGKVYTPLWTSTVIVRKEIFLQENGFAVECKVCEDIDLWCRLAARGSVAYINEPLANYRRDSSNMLSRSTSTTMYFPFLKNYKSYIDTDDSRFSSVCEFVEYRTLYAISFCLRNKNKRAARKYLQELKVTKENMKKYYSYAILLHIPQGLVDWIYEAKIAKDRKNGNK